VATASTWALGVYAALLPFHGIGVQRARDVLRVEAADAALVLAAPVLLLAIHRARAGLLGAPLFLGVIWLSGAELLSEVLSGPVSIGRLVQAVVPVLAVGGLVAAAAAGKLDLVLRGLLAGGALALTISVAGYALTLLGGLQLPAAFVFRSPHPLFPGVPRLTGTFGAHAVWLGEYCLVLLAVSLGAGQGAGPTALRAGAGAAAALGLLLSFSFAWLGGLVLATRAALSRWRATSRIRRFAWAAVAVAHVVASGALLLGGPVDVAASEPRPCAALDRLHHVTRPAGAGSCTQALGEWPYRHRITLYALAHSTALASYVAHPVLGLSRHGYRELAAERAQALHGASAGGYYTEPIGLFATTLARTGTVGALGLALLLVGVWRARPHVGERSPDVAWAFYGSVALLLSAIHTDLALRGPLWVSLGWLVAVAGQRPRERPQGAAVGAAQARQL
jgi:hypothetical protein